MTAIVVNWNGRRLLSACLDALAGQDYRPLEIIVVDNGSVDGSIELAAGRPGLQLIHNPLNLGFAVANNQGLELARGEFVLLLNYDAVLQPDYVSILVADLREDPRRGSTSGKLLRPVPPGRSPLLDSTGHVMFRNVQAMNRGEEEPDAGRYQQPENVFGVCAAAGLYRRTMLEDVMVDGEVLDASFFAYLEDVDLDWRAQLRGWGSWYDPRAVATHHRSASGGRFSIPIQRHIFTNRILMMIKNGDGRFIAARFPGIAALTAVKLVLGVAHGPSFLSAIGDLARLSPEAWRKRRQIQARRTVSPAAIERWFQPYPYLRKLRQARQARSKNQWISQS